MPSCRKRRAVSRSPESSRNVLAVEPSMDVADPRPVVRVALEVALVHVDDAAVRRAVDVVDRAADRRQAAGDERLAQPLGRDRQVGHRGEAAEALAEHAPALDAELAPDRLRVADDRIRPEVGQVGGLGLGACRPGWSCRPASIGRSRAGRAAARGSRWTARAIQPVGGAVGRAASMPGPPWRKRRYGRSRPSGSATSRVNTLIVGPSGCAWSSGTMCSRSVRTAPGTRVVKVIGRW